MTAKKTAAPVKDSHAHPTRKGEHAEHDAEPTKKGASAAKPAVVASKPSAVAKPPAKPAAKSGAPAPAAKAATRPADAKPAAKSSETRPAAKAGGKAAAGVPATKASPAAKGGKPATTKTVTAVEEDESLLAEADFEVEAEPEAEAEVEVEVDTKAEVAEKAKPLRMKVSRAKERALMREFGLEETTLSEEEAQKRRQELKTLIKMGKTRGFLTHQEINDHLPEKLVNEEILEAIVSMLNDMGIAVYEQAPDAATLLVAGGATATATEEEAEEAAEAALSTVDSEFGRTTDPVRMYMREMGTVELLTREGDRGS
jgi:RNA polymerase primary sigma factor